MNQPNTAIQLEMKTLLPKLETWLDYFTQPNVITKAHENEPGICYLLTSFFYFLNRQHTTDVLKFLHRAEFKALENLSSHHG